MTVENDEMGDYPNEDYSGDDSLAADQLQDQEYEGVVRLDLGRKSEECSVAAVTAWKITAGLLAVRGLILISRG